MTKSKISVYCKHQTTVKHSPYNDSCSDCYSTATMTVTASGAGKIYC